MTNELVAFLHARLDEDETAARAAREGPWAIRRDSIGNTEVYSVPRELQQGGDSSVFPDAWHEGSAGHAARHDPARVLREVETKRRILGRYENVLSSLATCSGDEVNSYRAMAHVMRGFARDIAYPYADHPNYRPEWLPYAGHPDYRKEWRT